MINTNIFKQEIKNIYKSFLIFLGIITMYTVIIITMYDPNLQSILDQFSNSVPALFEAFGMSNSSNNLLSFLINYLYGFILILIPLFYIIYMSYKLVSHHIDTKSLTYLLSTSIPRAVIIQTQLAIMFLMNFIFSIYITIIITITSILLFPGEINIINLLILNFGLCTFITLLGSLIFLIASLSKDGRTAIAYSSLFVVISYLINILTSMSNKVSILKSISIFQLFQVSNYSTYNIDNYLYISLMITISLIVSIITINYYSNRDFEL